ncbi:hypothetical protein Avbf_01291 [Armadillidium vulgare]|nr:hypothetical protein Avbf_01291 [Armadillidium vulgare]
MRFHALKCIGGCENGVHIRRVWCSPGINSLDHNCSLAERPPSTKPCTNPQACGAAWFTGPWTPIHYCSSLCGNGTKSREVVCVVYLRGSFRATFENECDPAKRPKETGVCNTQDCPPHWYFTDWTEISINNTDLSLTKVINLEDRGLSFLANIAAENAVEEAKEELFSALIQFNIRLSSAQLPRGLKQPDLATLSPAMNPDVIGNCVDRFQNCLMVLRARLCKYSYYKTICCATCNSNQ